MKPMISPRRMQECERAFFRSGSVPSIDVMERAARALADAIAAELPAGGRIDFACGPGGNGGDGLACARMLNGQYRCRVFLTKPQTHPDTVENLRRAKLAGVTVIEMESVDESACFGAIESLSHVQDLNATVAERSDYERVDRTNAENSVLYKPVDNSTTNAAHSAHLSGCGQTVGTLHGDGLEPFPSQDSASVDSDNAPPDAWVDALFGTGLSRAPRGAAAWLIERINRDHATGARVYAADVPSGLNGATGEAYSPCVISDRTVTFHMLKSGLKLADGLDACGEITVADVGFPAAQFPAEAQWLEPRDAVLPERPRNIHKGLCGHLLIVAGSFGMAGAAALCASAALRSGAGLVTIACARSIVPILQTIVPGAMCIPLAERDGAISAEAAETLRDALKGKSAMVVGCGLSRRAAPEIVETVLGSGLPAVVDADALNLMAEHPEMLRLLRSSHVLTPHPGEARRLFEAVSACAPTVHGKENEPSAPAQCEGNALSPQQNQGSVSVAASAQREGAAPTAFPVSTQCKKGAQAEPFDGSTGAGDALLGDPIAAARALHGLGATVLFKGAACVIAGENEVFVSSSGCCGMARGGSGDILAGIMGALLAERSERSPALSAALAIELHGRAGELAMAKYGSRAMNARDILEFLPEAFLGR